MLGGGAPWYIAWFHLSLESEVRAWASSSAKAWSTDPSTTGSRSFRIATYVERNDTNPQTVQRAHNLYKPGHVTPALNRNPNS